MKKHTKTYRILTLSLAFMMFFTSFGFSMDVHFCKGEIEKIQLFGTAECDMDMEPVMVVVENECCHKSVVEIRNTCHQEDSIDQSKCCYNETMVVDITDDVSNSEITDASVDQLTFFTLFVLSSYHIFFPEEKTEAFTTYSPPLISKDVSTLHQVFII